MSKSDTPYYRRLARGLANGLSPRAAAGHARLGETTASGRPPKTDPAVIAAIERIKAGDPLTAAAKNLHISRERLRRAVAERGDYIRQGGRYRFVERDRYNLPLYSSGQSIRVVVGPEPAAKLGAYMSAVGKFLRTNEIKHLAPFLGEGVTDIKGRVHPFETDPEELYRLDTKGRAQFHQVYQLSN